MTKSRIFATVIGVPTKTKNTKTTADKLAGVAQQIGLVMMTAAVTFGMFELPDRSSKIVIPNQPVFEFADNNSEANPNNPIRRENEENEMHYISYSVAQRTPSRAGKR